MKYHIVGADNLIDQMMQELGHQGRERAKTADIIIYTGGADVDPSLYGEPRHPETGVNPRRDAAEREYFQTYHGALQVGICRGAQFLNVMNGGKLWQDVDRHAIHGAHLCEIPWLGAGTFYRVTSTHHQMMRPTSEGIIWGTARLSTHRDTGTEFNRPTDFEKDGPDIEIVWYPKTRSLCFQPHPEYMNLECRELFAKCLEKALEQ